jgi:vacuolar protein sorting-associated protein 13A/C
VVDTLSVILIHNSDNLATLSLSTADVSVFLRPTTLRVTGRLGSLSLSNDAEEYSVREEFNEILSIEGQNFAEFRYQTFDPSEDSYTGVKSSVYLNAASVKLHFLEEPLHDIYLFVAKLAKLKGLYDAATQVAVQRASEIERMQFEISVKTPILVFPFNPAQARDVLVMRLGEISAHNTSEAAVNKIAASLRGIQLVSSLYRGEDVSVLKIIDDIDITADVVQSSGMGGEIDNDLPDTQVCISPFETRLSVLTIPIGCGQNLRYQVTSNSAAIWPFNTTFASDPPSCSRRGRANIFDQAFNVQCNELFHWR